MSSQASPATPGEPPCQPGDNCSIARPGQAYTKGGTAGSSAPHGVARLTQAGPSGTDLPGMTVPPLTTAPCTPVSAQTITGQACCHGDPGLCAGQGTRSLLAERGRRSGGRRASSRSAWLWAWPSSRRAAPVAGHPVFRPRRASVITRFRSYARDLADRLGPLALGGVAGSVPGTGPGHRLPVVCYRAWG